MRLKLAAHVDFSMHAYVSRYRQNFAIAYYTLIWCYTKPGFKTIKEIIILCTILEKTGSGQKTHFILKTVGLCSNTRLLALFNQESISRALVKETLFWIKTASKTELRQHEPSVQCQQS